MSLSTLNYKNKPEITRTNWKCSKLGLGDSVPPVRLCHMYLPNQGYEGIYTVHKLGLILSNI